MAELRGVSLGQHLQAIVSELEMCKTIYGYRQRDIFTGDPEHDFSVDFHDRRAYTQLGPASGPHTQLTQNIILAFLGGGRIFELKTVQILDQLDIGRPCIEAPNIGFNIEWSQELNLQASYDEYVKAWVLLKIIEDMELLGVPKGDPFYDFVFDISIGYDLKGVSSPIMVEWVKKLMNAEEAIRQMLHELPEPFSRYRDFEVDPHISNSATLSTFHGCPKEEVEGIVKFLIKEHGLHVIVKCNPTQLGYDWVNKTLLEDLGYSHLKLDRHAFEGDLSFEDAVPLLKRLEEFGAEHDKKVGAKYTNTLIVNHGESVMTNIEPGVPDKVMYLSGRPLHVIAMNGMHNMRSSLGSHFHISFSAGIDKENFVEAAACYLRPITTCTDLLQKGGYARMPAYLKNLGKAMDEAGASNMGEFLRARAGDDSLSLEEAGHINAQSLVPALVENPRYHNSQNSAMPRAIDSHLELWDCLTCNICLPVCPNAATFNIPIGKQNIAQTDFIYRDGGFAPVSGGEIQLKKKGQIAILADFCNECGNCDTFCPEQGGPYIEKPNFFFNRESYETDSKWDGFYFDSAHVMRGRIQGVEHSLEYSEMDDRYTYQGPGGRFVLDSEGGLVAGEAGEGLEDGTTVDMNSYYVMKILMQGLASAPAAYTNQFLLETS